MLRKLLAASAAALAIAAALPAEASISSSQSTVTAHGNGSTTSWPFSFLIPYQSNGTTPAVTVQEVTNGVVTTLTSGQYTITGVGSASGGSVTITPAVPTGTDVVITRSLNYTQPDTYSNIAFLPHSIEASLDKVEMQVQQLANGVFAPYGTIGTWTAAQAFNGGFSASTGTISGSLTVNGGISAAVSGNASTATTLQTGRTFGVSGDCITSVPPTFDGSVNLTIPVTCTKTNGTALGYFATGTSAASLTGTLNAAQFPAVSGDCAIAAGTLSITCTKTNGTALGYFATGTSAANLTGTIPASVLPNPSATTLGGVESYTSPAHQWINSISTLGAVASSQPGCADLSNAAASCSTDATNATNIGSGTLANARLQSDVALTDVAKSWTAKQTFENQTISALFQSRDFISPMDAAYGCAGDGSTDDTNCFQNALNASVGKILWLGNHKYVINGSLSTPSGPVHVEGVGTGWNSVVGAQDMSSCLYNTKANTLFFSLPSGSSLRNFCIMAAGKHAVAQGSITISGSVATISNAAGGPFTVGDTLTYSGAPANLTIASLGTGTGGNGTYNLSATPTAVASPITVTAQTVQNTSGHYHIELSPSAAGVTIENLWIDGGCIPIDINGSNNIVRKTIITGELGAGCMGMRVGYFTQNAGSVDDRLEDNEIAGVSIAGSIASNPADFGLALYDAGGLFMLHQDNLYHNIGCGIVPGTGSTGANQQVIWLFSTGSACGDTTVNQGMKIDTALSSNQIKGLNFLGSWTSSSTSGDEVWIKNTGGGLVTDINFIGERTYNMPGNGFTIGPNVGRVLISGAEICGYGIQGSTSAVGIEMLASAQNFIMTGSRVSPTCAGLSGSGQSAVKFDGSNNYVTLVGDDFVGNTNEKILSGSLAMTAMVMHDNLPIDNNSGTISTSTSALDLTQGGTIGGYYNSYFVSGATGGTITTLTNPGWQGRHFRLTATGAAGLTIGGNNSNGGFTGQVVTLPQYASADCIYNGGYTTCVGNQVQDASASLSKYSFTGATVSAQAQNTTTYLGSNGAQATGTNTAFVVPYASTITNALIAVDTTPASGQTFTFTVYDGATSLGSCTISNTQFSCNVPLSSAVSTGDQLYIKSVFSATSGAANVRYNLSLKG